MDDILERAERFVWLTGRVLEQRRFAYLFGDGTAAAVLAALRPYRNPDGGYGWALEPDGRGPTSQPVHADFALRVLDEVGAVDADFCAGLVPFTTADGGLPIVHPAIAPYPRPPWWAIPERVEGSLIPTAGIAGLLHRNHVEHPWLDGATAFCWDRIEKLVDGQGTTHPWEVLACVDFLDGVPDRDRARAASAGLGARVRAESLVVLDRDHPPAGPPPGYAPGEFHYPDDYAPRPDSLAREWFSDAEMDAALDALAAEQRPDGGWPVRWGKWNPAAELEFRSEVTLRALLRLRVYGR
ncbi:MAG: hypothetical protein ACJ73S_16520 [Mycobacteriales bacterium]